jgi:hypothetical protein
MKAGASQHSHRQDLKVFDRLRSEEFVPCLAAGVQTKSLIMIKSFGNKVLELTESLILAQNERWRRG